MPVEIEIPLFIVTLVHGSHPMVAGYHSQKASMSAISCLKLAVDASSTMLVPSQDWYLIGLGPKVSCRRSSRFDQVFRLSGLLGVQTASFLMRSLASSCWSWIGSHGPLGHLTP